MVNLVTVKDRELMKVGKWSIHQTPDGEPGEWEVTPQMIQAAISAHNAGVLRKPTARLGHNDERFSGDPAVGWFDNLRVSDDGNTLYGDLVNAPQWLGEIMASAYPSLSIEGLHDFTASDGTAYDFVLTGVALLGATPPGIGELKSVQDVAQLYDIAAAAGELGGTPVRFTVEANAPLTPAKSHADPGYLDKDGNQAKGGNGVARYAIDDAGQVRAALGYFTKNADKEHYTAAQRKEVLGKIHAAAKKFGVTVSDDDGKKAAASAAPNKEGAIVAIPDKLAEALGIDASADEDTILAKIAELKAPAPEPEPEPKPEPVAAASGLVQIEQAQLDELKAAAAQGVEARARQIADDDQHVVMAAIAEGKIAPARKQHWLDSLKADRDGTKQVLASLAAGLVPVKETGHQGVAGAVGFESGGADAQDEHVKEYAFSKVMAQLGIPTTKGSVN